MKKLMMLAAVAVIGLSSCKKTYECCTSTTIDGTVTASACVTYEKLSKSDADALESSVTVGTSTVATVCEPQ